MTDTVSVCDGKPPGIRNTVQEFLGSFSVYDWLWRDDKDKVTDDTDRHMFIHGPIAVCKRWWLDGQRLEMALVDSINEYSLSCFCLLPLLF
jgi:hypothetical protein